MNFKKIFLFSTGSRDYGVKKVRAPLSLALSLSLFLSLPQTQTLSLSLTPQYFITALPLWVPLYKFDGYHVDGPNLKTSEKFCGKSATRLL